MKMILHALSALSAAALLSAAEPLDLPTGREVTLPLEVHGTYRLEAENGRVLATGNADGQPCFLPCASETGHFPAGQADRGSAVHSPAAPLAAASRRNPGPLQFETGTAPETDRRRSRCR
ncbi:MAG: hypothetical protein L6W00_20000 [Lentisphaeria bacterium]|nr:MAG: hypothetical protein L6W00_20000 [Lentisphaeria bacterium]